LLVMVGYFRLCPLPIEISRRVARSTPFSTLGKTYLRMLLVCCSYFEIANFSFFFSVCSGKNEPYCCGFITTCITLKFKKFLSKDELNTFSLFVFGVENANPGIHTEQFIHSYGINVNSVMWKSKFQQNLLKFLFLEGLFSVCLVWGLVQKVRIRGLRSSGIWILLL
jgi:hypothetical protein